MLDRRSSYRAVSIKREPNMWRVQFRRWWSPFWVTFTHAHGLDRARDYAINHATPRPRQVVSFGKLPESSDA